MKRPLSIAALIGMLVLAAGCGGSSSGDASAQASKPLHMVEAQKILHRPYEFKQVPKGPAPEELVVKELHRGYGAPTKDGEKVALMYQVADYEDKSGKYFYSAWNTIKFFSFKLGGGEASPSWEEAVKGMRLGARREVIMPTDQVTGPKASPVYPKTAKTLIFIADLYLRG